MGVRAGRALLRSPAVTVLTVTTALSPSMRVFRRGRLLMSWPRHELNDGVQIRSCPTAGGDCSGYRRSEKPLISSLGSVISLLMLGTTPPRFCKSEGMMILVALPLATLASASRLGRRQTDCGRAQLVQQADGVGVGLLTARGMACASPSASRMRCRLTASARGWRILFALSAAVMAACFSPSLSG